LPKKPCTLTANVGNVSKDAKNAIMQVLNNAGVYVDFVNGPSDLTFTNSTSLPWGFLGNNPDFGPNPGIDVGQIYNQTALGIIIAHEWGHYLVPCAHGTGGGSCGTSGLMAPGGYPIHDIPYGQFSASSPDWNFTSPQAQRVQEKCQSLK
jgi:hypothetical protein